VEDAQEQTAPASPIDEVNSGSRGLPPWLQRIERWLWLNEQENRGRLMHGLWHACRVLFAVVRDVSLGNITLHAMSLVYTTLLSIVPMIALSFSVLKGLGAHNDLEPILHSAVEPLGAEGEALVGQILGFVDNMQVGVLGSVGLGMLVYTVISLIQKVERAFNEIWRVGQVRSMAQRFSNYLSVIVIGPVLIVSALGTTATVVGSDMVKDLLTIQPFGMLFSILSRLMPYLMIIALFTFVYAFIPNTRVKLRYALIGGVVAGVTWQSAIYGFTQFVVNSNYQAIYSGFAVGILLLIWLYVAWLILLMGASVAFYSQNAKYITRERQLSTSACLDERIGLGLFFQVARTFHEGRGVCPLTELDKTLRAGPEINHRLLKKLVRAGLLVYAGPHGEGLTPGRPLEHISVAEVLDAVRSQEQLFPLYVASDMQAAEVVAEIEQAVHKKYDSITVAQWLDRHHHSPHDVVS
tara:strand:- start:27852 stop:29249 length:1398 start_codon:yes stop_codon:yes gene_type:complete